MTSSSSLSRTFSVCISFSLLWKIEDIKKYIVVILYVRFYCAKSLCAFVSVSMRDITSRSACVSLPLTRIRTDGAKKKVKKGRLCTSLLFSLAFRRVCFLWCSSLGYYYQATFFFGCWFLYPLCVSPIISGANNNLLLLFSYLIMLQSVGIPDGRFGQ